MITVILVMIAGILLPWIYNRRGESRRNFCEMRQIMLAKAVFMRAVETPSFPGYRDVQATGPENLPIESSWVFPTLPYLHPYGGEFGEEIHRQKANELLESENYKDYLRGPYQSVYEEYGPTGTAAGRKIPLYLEELVCPDSGKTPEPGGAQPLSFVANCGMPDSVSNDHPEDHLSNGVFFDAVHGKQKMNLKYLYDHDGIEVTLMLSENLNTGESFDTEESRVGFVWVDSVVDGFPELDREQLLGINEKHEGQPSYRSARPSGNHTGGVNVAFCDGSTQFLNEKIDYLVYVQYMSPASEELKKPGTDDLLPAPYGKNPLEQNDSEHKKKNDLAEESPTKK